MHCPHTTPPSISITVRMFHLSSSPTAVLTLPYLLRSSSGLGNVVFFPRQTSRNKPDCQSDTTAVDSKEDNIVVYYSITVKPLSMTPPTKLPGFLIPNCTLLVLSTFVKPSTPFCLHLKRQSLSTHAIPRCQHTVALPATASHSMSKFSPVVNTISSLPPLVEQLSTSI